ncbi:hypothetical protein DYB25_011076 [Aphanomyces astaci]|uniref:Uncharacterized protein n=1 Tax=Aphanomyces astaci TaxID=112090 RepID=A0A397BZ03_APHAT|nr:hypothetical protein DYB25_011076 [Aphanomyces astaci]RHY37736.1 hypothetical protein DYB38_011568 [Aphanomyces astaci]RHY40394.1 hypothetical protein DYB30_008490 [Aphanomyces astaci]RHY41298.1 hypothetical protein DYB34_011941 [Aphanomyces astaci]RHZ05834.1 hypothetical protein DYB31_012403 [Aphanomyces astaci]
MLDLHSISKPAALRITSAAWSERIVPKNIKAGFRATSLWPLSHEHMVKKFNLLKDGGRPSMWVGEFLTLAHLWELDKTKQQRQEAKGLKDALVAKRKKKRGAALELSAAATK